MIRLPSTSDRRSLIAACATLALGASLAHADVTALKAKTVHVGDGAVIENGVVLIQDGRITAVGADLEIPDNATVIEMPDGAVTPGLIDANALLEPEDLLISDDATPNALQMMFRMDDSMVGHEEHAHCPLEEYHPNLNATEICPVCGGDSHGDQVQDLVSGVNPFSTRTEFSNEVVPHTRVIDSINFDSPDFGRLLRGGVTTVFASPDAAAVIGPKGAIVRTAKVENRILNGDGAVQMTVGSDAWSSGGRNSTPNRRGASINARRPNSHMGLAWVLRKAFYDTENFAQNRPVSGADAPDAEAFPVLTQIRTGEVPLRVQARTDMDFAITKRIAEEFGLNLTLLEATEAYKSIDLIRQTGWPVIFGPIFAEPSGVRARTGDARDSRLITFKALLDAGVPTALSAQDLREEDGLARQVMYAMKTGVDREQALRAVTLTPAEMLGLSEELGSVAQGKRADLVIWNGAPFAATSRVVAVIVDGQLVVDERE